MKISTPSTLAIHAMAYLAASGATAPVSAGAIGAALGVSPSHLSKVLQGLARGGLIRSTRGARGGFALGVDPNGISLLQVVQAVSGPALEEECLLGPRICEPGRCKLAGVTAKVSALITEELRRMTLAQFSNPRPARPRAARRRTS